MKATHCDVPTCEATVHAKGYCLTHYARWKRTGTTETTRVFTDTCTVDGCDKPHASRGLCRTHASRLRRTGTTDPKPKARTKFWSLVAKADDSECWLWQGPVNNSGYGRLGHDYAHRIACEIAHGQPAPGQVALHACDNPPCVNPGHLRWGTQAENIQESYDRSRR